MPNAPQTTHTEFAHIGERLERIRTSLSTLNQVDWASKHGFSTTQWNNWEVGARRISLDAAMRLCDTYGLTLDFIYRGRREALSAALRDAL